MKSFSQHLEESQIPYTTHGYWMGPKGELHPVEDGDFRSKAEEISYGEGITFLQNNGWMQLIANNYELRVTVPKYMSKDQRDTLSHLVREYIMRLKMVIMKRRNGDTLIDSTKGMTVKGLLDQWETVRKTVL